MQIKIYAIPVAGGEQMLEEMNAFLRSRKIIQIEQVMVQEPGGALWSFCIRYIYHRKAGRHPMNRRLSCSHFWDEKSRLAGI